MFSAVPRPALPPQRPAQRVASALLAWGLLAGVSGVMNGVASGAAHGQTVAANTPPMALARAGGPADATEHPVWQHLLRHLQRQAPAQRLEVINLAINQLDHAFVPGATVWQRPAELIARGQGDCKDFALAKFYLLRHHGMAREQVRLAYADWNDGSRWQPHMVVLVWIDGGSPVVLDNLVPGLHRLDHRPDLSVRFSFDERAFYDRVGPQQIADQPVRGWAGLWDRLAPPRLSAARRSPAPG